MPPNSQSSRVPSRPARPASQANPASKPADAARHVAYSHLADIATRLPDLDPRPVPDKGLSARDAAFAHAIVHAGLQRWLTLSYILGGFLSRPFAELEPQLRGVLIGGAAQILLLDKVPVHAAINESVEWAKSTIRPGAGGMVNAVLRKVAGLLPAAVPTPSPWSGRRDEILLADGSARTLTTAVLPDDPHERLAVATSHPTSLSEAWAARFGPVDGRRLLLHSLAAPPTVLYTAARGDAPLPPSLGQHVSPDHHVFTGPREELQSLLKERPHLWVQDVASSEPVRAASHLTPNLILDLCAGQGTKTRQLAHTFPKARIVATDTDEDRFRTLRQIFKGSSQVQTPNPAEVVSRFKDQADLILLDVPCSNTGVLARRVEAKYRSGTKQLERLTQLQRSIFETAIALLAPRGRILYSTCSLEPEENENQAAWAADRFELIVEKSGRTLPTGVPGEPGSQYRDGSYFALLTRPA